MTENLEITPTQLDGILLRMPIEWDDDEFYDWLDENTAQDNEDEFTTDGENTYKIITTRHVNENTVEERRCQFCHTIIEKGEYCNCPPLE